MACRCDVVGGKCVGGTVILANSKSLLSVRGGSIVWLFGLTCVRACSINEGVAVAGSLFVGSS